MRRDELTDWERLKMWLKFVTLPFSGAYSLMFLIQWVDSIWRHNTVRFLVRESHPIMYSVEVLILSSIFIVNIIFLWDTVREIEGAG